ncbi:uncharacterized protein LOC141906226 [Tubulanus polymorphus]|uniref:uncharacterized protein LOC141906226 n=1 Tax=Tubulanus polymorphus TaxID=672921 RepID=UPI003DA6373B
MILRNEMNTSINASRLSGTTENSLLSLENVQNDDVKMKFLTGLAFVQFLALFQFLGPCTNVRCSIDCTEFFVQMPGNLGRQANLFSNYKHHHDTFKCLIAVAPNGTAIFVSDLFEDTISDRDIFEKCGILNHFKPGDLILADRGFIVEDLLMSRQVSFNIPPFLSGREKLTPQEELLTRKIAKARVHVERYNERIKKFRLISGIMPLNMTPLATQAVFVSCFLVNFQEQLAT